MDVGVANEPSLYTMQGAPQGAMNQRLAARAAATATLNRTHQLATPSRADSEPLFQTSMESSFAGPYVDATAGNSGRSTSALCSSTGDSNLRSQPSGDFHNGAEPMWPAHEPLTIERAQKNFAAARKSRSDSVATVPDALGGREDQRTDALQPLPPSRSRQPEDKLPPGTANDCHKQVACAAAPGGENLGDDATLMPAPEDTAIESLALGTPRDGAPAAQPADSPLSAACPAPRLTPPPSLSVSDFCAVLGLPVGVADLTNCPVWYAKLDTSVYPNSSAVNDNFEPYDTRVGRAVRARVMAVRAMSAHSPQALKNLKAFFIRSGETISLEYAGGRGQAVEAILDYYIEELLTQLEVQAAANNVCLKFSQLLQTIPSLAGEKVVELQMIGNARNGHTGIEQALSIVEAHYLSGPLDTSRLAYELITWNGCQDKIDGGTPSAHGNTAAFLLQQLVMAGKPIGVSEANIIDKWRTCIHVVEISKPAGNAQALHAGLVADAFLSHGKPTATCKTLAELQPFLRAVGGLQTGSKIPLPPLGRPGRGHESSDEEDTQTGEILSECSSAVT